MREIGEEDRIHRVFQWVKTSRAYSFRIVLYTDEKPRFIYNHDLDHR